MNQICTISVSDNLSCLSLFKKERDAVCTVTIATRYVTHYYKKNLQDLGLAMHEMCWLKRMHIITNRKYFDEPYRLARCLVFGANSI
jgi:hypothetical protein